MLRGFLEQVGNIELGIPIRVVRKNKDAASEYGNIFIYDGLYDVVRMPFTCRASHFLQTLPKLVSGISCGSGCMLESSSFSKILLALFKCCVGRLVVVRGNAAVP